MDLDALVGSLYRGDLGYPDFVRRYGLLLLNRAGIVSRAQLTVARRYVIVAIMVASINTSKRVK